MKKRKMYKAQALAIIMVILVVSSIIGLSVIARTMKDKGTALQERDSAEAYEVVDTILDNMLLTNLEDWRKVMTENESYVNDEISELTETLLHPLDLSNLAICPLTEEGNKYELSLSRVAPDKEYILLPGETFSFPVSGKTLGANCTLTIFPKGSFGGGFVHNTIRRDSAGILPYDYDDTINYCFAINGVCARGLSHNWEGIDLSGGKIGPVSLTSAIDNIQITAIKAPMSFSFTASNCGDSFRSWQLRASATCNGVYRAKEVVVPETRGNNTIFNYSLFNAVGNMSSAQ